MFFMAKSTLCIGVVAVLAAGASGRGDIRDAVATGGRAAAASLGRSCAASTDCVGLGTRVAAAALGQTGAIPASLVQAGIVRASEGLALPLPPTASAPGAEAEHPLHAVPRHLRRSLVARD